MAGLQVEALQKSQQALEKTMGAKDYEAKVPEAVREENAEKAAKLAAEAEAATKAIEDFRRLALADSAC